MSRLVLGIFLLLNCVYYNTFYNAQKYYDEGLKQKRESGGGTNSFQKSIEKCNKVLDRYSSSKWVDDAIFLLGMSFYHLNQFDNAKINLEKIIENYSDSPFVKESTLYLGKIALLEGKITESVILLDRAADSEKLDIRMEAFKTKLEIYLKEGSPEKAIAAGQDFINKYKTHKAEVYYIMGNAYNKIEEYSKALEMYKKSWKEAREWEVEGLRYNLASIYVNLDSLPEALSVIGDYNKADSLIILKGRILREMERYEESEAALKFAKNLRNKIGATANYELGLLKEIQGDFEEAEKLFSQATGLGNFGKITSLSSSKSDILELLSYLNTDSGAVDSTEYRKDPAYIYFRIGELYYLELNDLGKAVESYKKVFEDYPVSLYAPKALYVLLNIYSKELNDSSQVSYYLSKLIDLYPETDYAKKSMEEFGGIFSDTNSN